MVFSGSEFSAGTDRSDTYVTFTRRPRAVSNRCVMFLSGDLYNTYTARVLLLAHWIYTTGGVVC